MIFLQKLSKDKVELKISDNGIGFPGHINVGPPQSLGLHLVHILTGQIEGSIIVKRGKGTVFLIQFDIKKNRG